MAARLKRKPFDIVESDAKRMKTAPEVKIVKQTIKCPICWSINESSVCALCKSYKEDRKKCLHVFLSTEEKFHGGTIDKIRVNKDMSRRALEYTKGRDQSSVALILDGTDEATRRELITVCGLKTENIITPNPHLKTRIPCLLFDAIQQHPADKPFTLINADYMCSAAGNEHTRPRIDIDHVFHRRLLCPEGRASLFIVQLCHSRKKKRDVERPRQTQNKFAEWFFNRTHYHQYIAKQLTESDAYPMMHVYFFEITSAITSPIRIAPSTLAITHSPTSTAPKRIAEDNDDDGQDPTIVTTALLSVMSTPQPQFSVHPHPLVWMLSPYFSNTFRCNVCRKLFSDTGSFQCLTCPPLPGYEECANCYRECTGKHHSTSISTSSSPTEQNRQKCTKGCQWVVHSVETRTEEYFSSVRGCQRASCKICQIQAWLHVEKQSRLTVIYCDHCKMENYAVRKHKEHYLCDKKFGGCGKNVSPFNARPNSHPQKCKDGKCEWTTKGIEQEGKNIGKEKRVCVNCGDQKWITPTVKNAPVCTICNHYRCMPSLRGCGKSFSKDCDVCMKFTSKLFTGPSGEQLRQLQCMDCAKIEHVLVC